MYAPKTVGIGSLPFADEASAIEHVFDAYDVPFFPQLVQHHRYRAVNAPQMLQEVVPIPLLEILLTGNWTHQSLIEQMWLQSHPEHMESLPGWNLFIHRLQTTQPATCKLQLCGPETAIRIIESLTGKAMPESLRDLMYRAIVAQAQAMSARTRVHAQQCIMLWDEGEALVNGNLDTLRRLDDVCKAVEVSNVISGVHCCAPFNLKNFLVIAQDRYLAVDLTLPEFANSQAAQILEQIAREGGVIAGVVNTQAADVHDLQAETAYTFAQQLLRNNDSRLPHLISGACGSGLKTPSFETAMARCLRSLVHLSHPTT